MPQVLKAEVRTKITEAALVVFARDGFAAATMAGIADAANVGAASIYRYYASKDELFSAVITPALTKQFDALLERRVGALAKTALRGETIDDVGGEMLQFWLANRLAVVILLDRAAGTEHAAYGERFVELLVKHTIAELRATGAAISPRAKLVLTEIFDNTRRLLARVLAEYSAPAELREAIQTFWSYQIAGLQGLSAWLRQADRETASAADSRTPSTRRR